MTPTEQLLFKNETEALKVKLGYEQLAVRVTQLETIIAAQDDLLRVYRETFEELKGKS